MLPFEAEHIQPVFIGPKFVLHTQHTTGLQHAAPANEMSVLSTLHISFFNVRGRAEIMPIVLYEAEHKERRLGQHVRSSAKPAFPS